MAFVIDRFWLPLLLAGMIGIMIGWATCGQERGKSWLSSWLPLGILAAIAGGVALAQDAVPGRYGLWLETALMMFLVYLAGCCVSCFLHGLFSGPRAAEKDPNAEIFARKMAGINSIADEKRAKEASGLGSAAAAGTKTAAVTLTSSREAEDSRPQLLSGPRAGGADDLTLIWGVAAKLEKQMNALGIWHFDQIAAWKPQHVAWFESQIEGFKGRLDRDKWIEQAAKLASGWRPDNKAGTRPKA